MSAILANPNGANRTVSTFVTGRDDDGIPMVVGRQVVDAHRADATILQGQALMYVAPTATVPLSVTPMTAAVVTSDPWRFAGVALEGAAAGDQVRYCVQGFCEVLFDASSTAAAYSLLNLPAVTTGEFDIATDPADNVESAGWVLGAEIGSTDKCLANIGVPYVRFEAGA